MSIAEHPRGTSAAARLARLGFVDPGRAARLLSGVGVLGEDDVLTALGATADPDLAALGLVRLVEAARDREELFAALGSDHHLRTKLLGVLGASAALGEHLARHPGDWRVLAVRGQAAPTQRELERVLLAAVGADPDRRAGEPGP